MPDGLPTWDQAISAAPQAAPPPTLPTWDKAFSDATAPNPFMTALSAGAEIANNGLAAEAGAGATVPPSSAATDQFLATTAVGRVLDAFGQGAKQGWGAEPLGMSPDTEAFMKKAGLFNDFQDGHTGIMKSFNEAILRPAATTLDAGMRAGSAVFGAYSGAVAQAGAEVGAPRLGRDLAALPEFMMGHPEGISPVPHAIDLPAARSLGVIGEGEGGYFDTSVPTPRTLDDRAAAAKTQAQALQEQAPENAGAGEATPPATPPDIHAIARQIAPDTFSEYDALAQQQADMRNVVSGRVADSQAEVADQFKAKLDPAQQTVDDLQRQLEGFQKAGNESKAKLVTNRLAKAQDALDSVQSDMADAQDAAARAARTDLAADMQKIDFRMRDLAPDVSDAYRRAQGYIEDGQEPPVSASAEPTAAAPIEPQASPEPVAAQPQETAQPAAAPADAVAQQADAASAPAAAPEPSPSIVADVTRQLDQAGRPSDESYAAAQLVAAHYEARASRFGGDLGTPEEMYQRDGAKVVGGDTGGRNGAAQGKAFIKNGKTTITLFEKADASTFLHETGHHWLEELMSDAKNEKAPDDLKADAQTVRSWLGAEDGADIKRGQHEKFARGFERYLMEGVAPSKELAGVFAKFKDWLTKIYQTVSRLKAPINDDIRDVFNRLISANPEKTVIAPEREISKNFADIHEAEAASTPPEKAAAVADGIDSEVLHIAAEKKPDIHGELSGTGPGSPGGEPPADSGASGGADAAEPVPAGSGGAAEPGAVPTGGDGAQGEGADVRTAAGSASRTAAGSDRGEQPTGPHAILPEPESQYVDKAGNIRLDNLGTSEDVNAAMREEAELHNDFYAARRGVVSDRDVMDLADAMGVQAREINLQKLRDMSVNDGIPLAARVRVGRLMLVDAATAVSDLMRNGDPGNPADIEAYVTSRNRLIMIQETVSGITAEIGRGLRAFQSLGAGAVQEAKAIGDYLKENTGKTLFQIQNEMKLGKKLDTPAKVAGFIRDVNKPSLGDKLLEVFTNWLISGPITHMTYSEGNSLLAFYKATFETGTAAAIGSVRELLGKGDADRVYWGEVPAQVFGRFRGQRDGWRAAYDALKTGTTIALPGENMAGAIAEIASRTAREEGLTNEARTQRIAELTANPTLEMSEEAQKMVGDAISAVGANPFVQRKAIGGPIGSIVRAPGERMVAPLHSLFRSLAYSQEIARLAYRTAAKEGLEGHGLAMRIAELTTHPPLDMMQAARDEATQSTLMGKGGDLTQHVTRLMNWNPNIPGLGNTRLLRFIDPFVTVASNVMDQGVVQRGLPGLLSGDIRASLAGINGPIARDTTAARIVAGTSLSVVAGGLAAEGLITPSAPTDPKEAAMSRIVNGAPHSLRIGNISLDLSRLGPLGMQVGIAADLYHFVHAIGREDAGKVASLLAHSFAQNFLDESFMKGPADLLKAVEDSDRFGAAYVRNFVATAAVPFSVGMAQIAGQVDPYAREARTTLDAMIAKIPFASETLHPRYDIWGQPVLNREYVGVYSQRVSSDPVNQALTKLNIFPSRPERKIRGVQLTEQQYDDFSRISGRMSKAQLDQFIRQPGFQSIPETAQAETIHSMLNRSREAAADWVMIHNPQIMQDAIKAKTAPLRTAQ
ncbi:MAG TPA: hypothetical protein VGV37_06445 [Aliidongia sp.]|uniref:hypothetical protein n=1 Tax=Aliidongia sp. TaxID=1914230 RepID=UPI002DDD7345|nr:hypothetical protein [Aliidongia sp.]HEV2674165.1 hypothetical protein [Aliidongia sp.]